MGLDTNSLDFLNKNLEQVGLKDVKLKMIELGDQVFQADMITTGKQYFTSIGYDHTSVDINGLHGAVVKDLRKPDQFIEWHNGFDILTNFGTTEHVEPLADQHQCWNIIHDIVKPGGYFLHALPDVDQLDRYGHWHGHCNFYYSSRFFQRLAEVNGYELIDWQYVPGFGNSTIHAFLRKTVDSQYKISQQELTDLIAVR